MKNERLFVCRPYAQMTAGPRLTALKQESCLIQAARGHNTAAAKEREPAASGSGNRNQKIDEKNSSYEGEQEMFCEQDAPCS